MKITHLGNMPFKNNKNLPKLIYKYRIWGDESHKTILTKRIVFFAPPSSFEDKNDCKLHKRYDLMTKSDIYNKYLNFSKKNHEHWNNQQHSLFAKKWTERSPLTNLEYVSKLQTEHFKDFDSKFGILCLTTNPNNLKMWNKYSQNGKGFCVGFDPEILFELTGGGRPVDYPKTLPIIHHDDNYLIERIKQVYSKEKKWSFEEEYRTHKTFFNVASKKDRQVKVPPEAYKVIIFGWSTPDKSKAEIKKTCNENGLNVVFKVCSLKMNEIEIITCG